MVRWLSSFLGDRYTVLALSGFEQPRAPIATGIPQRLPLSPILYLFYKADLMGEELVDTRPGPRELPQEPPQYPTPTLRLPTSPIYRTSSAAGTDGSLYEPSEPSTAPPSATSSPEPGEPHDPRGVAAITRLGYIDDTTILAVSDSAGTNCQARDVVFEARCRQWATTHASVFAPQKFALLHQHDPSLCRAFPRNQGCPGLGPPLALDSILVPPTNSATLLGVHLDQHLTFGPHLDCIDRCCARGLQALSALGGSRWGLSLHEND
ncbi:hypothetical protein ASPSYDRAFT_464520 [Aspergillus sydowii CBS 593.65]|uniref:Reverse transcriptase domain-containing protein n=1 Tax=Aspergillus sydowii CBS 593.65 TaxID=1036612 RepID=A0A1L9T4L9_9EURO|nr:uncharacterized protein ASPSYDRAFT_464520 [Aspergillus sydowii CBS 593.65]OJJ54400.1 hypothetical protein ASPSYDRAFT_464520 [Aspergillus sydowii CBS 593.65]